MSIDTELKDWIRGAAQALGFELCGFAPAQLDGGAQARYRDWLARGYQGEMAYLEKPQRQEVAALLPTVRSVICAGMVYNTAHPLSADCDNPARGWISRYAWGQDYHPLMQERLEQLLAELRAKIALPFEAKVYVDTGPLQERALARAAGLGWQAKNTCLINERIGSWFFLGEILTSLELEPDLPAWDRCGSCTRCLDACPTGALPEPYVLDAGRCIAYHTIELKGAIPEHFRRGMGRHVFGCDICQDVCPWNREAPYSPLPEFEPRPLEAPGAQKRGTEERMSSADPGSLQLTDPRPDEELAPAANAPRLSPSPSPGPSPNLPRGAASEAGRTAFHPPLEFLASLSEAEFFRLFRNSPLRRPRYRGFLRNVAVAMGNSRDPKFRPVLEGLAESPEPLVREHALWALDQLP